jgi:hypothetical protein
MVVGTVVKEKDEGAKQKRMKDEGGRMKKEAARHFFSKEYPG